MCYKTEIAVESFVSTNIDYIKIHTSTTATIYQVHMQFIFISHKGFKKVLVIITKSTHKFLQKTKIFQNSINRITQWTQDPYSVIL